MPGPGCYKDFVTTPIIGQLDLRSPSGTLGKDDFRLAYNVTLNEQKNRCRAAGWKKLFADSPFGFQNQDYHDQLVGCQTYYEEFSGSRSFQGGLVDIAYLYDTPGYTVTHPGSTANYGPFCGYYLDSVPPWSLTPSTLDNYVVRSPFVGYPYFSFPSDPLALCNTGDPFYYPGSYYSLSYSHQDPDEVFAPYKSGPIGLYEASYTEDYTRCGDFLYTRNGCREAITLLGQADSENGSRKLVAGTKSRLVVLNERTGNWKLIADGLGGPFDPPDNCNCSTRRFSMDKMGGYAFFTNNYDPVLEWRYDAPNAGCKLWGADYVDDLLTIGITRARVVCTWQGFLFVANVEQDGIQRPFRIFWSDFNNPTSFIPGAESLAGTTDLGAGETIMAIARLGGGLRIYTDRSIYAVTLVGGDIGFAITEIYSGPNVLAYAYSLANAGDTHYYMSVDTVYSLRESDRVPVFTQWIDKAAGAIYVGVAQSYLKDFPLLQPFGPVNRAACDQVIGYFRRETNELFFSWPSGTNVCNDHTLRIGLTPTYLGSDIIDHGFSAFTEFISDPRMTMREFFIDQQICGWDSFLGELSKEGIPYSMEVADFPNPPSNLLNDTEDPSLPGSPDSWCVRLGNKTLEDFCQDCETSITFIGACASDKTLKEFDPEVFYRERYIDTGETLECPYTVIGTYARDGYTSLLQGDLLDYGVKQDKKITRVILDFVAAEQTTPNILRCAVAYSNNAECPRWSETKEEEFACLSNFTDAEHDFYKTRPSLPALFNFSRRGRYLGYRFWLEGSGGAGCFTQITRKMRMAQGTTDWK